MNMRCLNCGEDIPETAQACQYCESVVEPEPTAEDEKLVLELLAQLPPEALGALHAAFDESETADDFVNRIFVGDCPNCGSSETGNCENDPEICGILVGRCYKCGQLWCTECLKLLTSDLPCCDCWDEDEDELE